MTARAVLARRPSRARSPPHRGATPRARFQFQRTPAPMLAIVSLDGTIAARGVEHSTRIGKHQETRAGSARWQATTARGFARTPSSPATSRSENPRTEFAPPNSELLARNERLIGDLTFDETARRPPGRQRPPQRRAAAQRVPARLRAFAIAVPYTASSLLLPLFRLRVYCTRTVHPPVLARVLRTVAQRHRPAPDHGRQATFDARERLRRCRSDGRRSPPKVAGSTVPAAEAPGCIAAPANAPAPLTSNVSSTRPVSTSEPT